LNVDQTSPAAKGIWISWERQRRNPGISSGLGWPLLEILPHRSRLIRYLACPILTVTAILRHRPDVLVAQNPSIILAALAVSLKRVLRYRCLIDAHNSGLYPGEEKHRGAMWLSRWLQRRADLTIVSNDGLVDVVEGNGGKAFVLPDRLPQPGAMKAVGWPGERRVVFICTFSEDEPYTAVLEAAGRLPGDVTLYVTGRYRGKVDADNVPGNVRLLGFISDDEYWSLLDQAHALLILTYRESCLLCGAYEGVALGKPLILSDTRALRSYFHSGAVYVQPTAASIAAGIELGLARADLLEEESAALGRELRARWDERLKQLQDLISG
jgi:glycosyltransferase involved in cell wall biosynthesis